MTCTVEYSFSFPMNLASCISEQMDVSESIDVTSQWTLCHQLRSGTRSFRWWIMSWRGYSFTTMVVPHWWELMEGRKEMFYLTTHSTHVIYGYMASDIWLRTILIVRKETRCRHIGYSFRLTARVLLYAPSHRQDSTYHGLCYTSRGALAGTRNSSIELMERLMPISTRMKHCKCVQQDLQIYPQ